MEIALARRDGNAARVMVASGVGKGRFDVLRTRLNALTDDLDAERARLSAAREHRARQLGGLMIAVPVVALAFIAAIGALLRRWLTRPLHDIVDGVVRITAGGLTGTVRVAGATDIAQIATSVNIMRGTIRDRLREAEIAREHAIRTREALEQNALVLLQLRGELASGLGRFPPLGRWRPIGCPPKAS